VANVGVIGASGFAGLELLRLCAGHPDLDVTVATGDTQAGTPIAVLYPSLAGAYGRRTFDTYDADVVAHITRLVDVAEWKRRQAPIGVRVSPKAFGKDRRLPITNGYSG
jgi:N-acetyl-gamma-glutamylphosphate reductase